MLDVQPLFLYGVTAISQLWSWVVTLSPGRNYKQPAHTQCQEKPAVITMRKLVQSNHAQPRLEWVHQVTVNM